MGLDVGDVALVHRPPLSGAHAVLDVADRHPERLEKRGHPLHLPADKEVVGGDEVHAPRGQRVQIHRQRRREGLTLTGLHLRDASLVEHDATHHLHIEGPHLQRPLRRLAHNRKGLDEQIVDGLPLLQAPAELRGLPTQLLIAQPLELRLQRIDLLHARAK